MTRLGRAYSTTREIYLEVKEHDLLGAAAELAFRQFLALFPFFIFVGALAASLARLLDVENPTDELMDLLGGSVPEDLSSVLRNELRSAIDASNVGLLSIGILAAIWASSSGINTIIKTLNRIYGVQETRPFWIRYLASILLTVIAGTVLVAAFFVLIVGQVYGLEVAAELGLSDLATKVIYYGRWPAVVIAVMLAVDFLYWAAPNLRTHFFWVTPGALLFTLAWMGSTYLFGLYVASFGSYNTTYGALGAVVVLMLWFYLTSFILFLGAEVNVILENRVIRPATVTSSHTPPAVTIAPGEQRESGA